MTSRINNALFIALMFFIYVKWHFGGLSYAAAFGVSLIVLARTPAMRRIIPVIVIFGYFLLLQQLILSSFLHWQLDKDTIKFAIYSLTNLTILAATFSLCQQFEGDTAKALKGVLLTMTIIGILEIYGGFRPIFNTIKLFFNDTAAYTSDIRDLTIYGELRAMIFTTEPSSAGNFFGSVWMGYIVAEKNFMKRLFWGGGFLAAALVLTRSPTLLAYVAVSPTFLLLVRGKVLTSLIYILTIIAATSSVFYYGWTIRNEIGIPEIAKFFSTGSFYIRQISPIETARAILDVSPIFGAGANYFKFAREETVSPLINMFGGFYSYERVVSMPDRVMATNAFWEFIGRYGLLGLMVSGAIMAYTLKVFGVKNPIVLLFGFLAISTSHSGIVDAFTWTPLIFMVFALSKNNHERTARPYFLGPANYQVIHFKNNTATPEYFSGTTGTPASGTI